MLTTTLLSRSLRATAPALRSRPAAILSRNVNTLNPILYTAVATSKGSRAKGASSTEEKNVSVMMGMPKEMGGTANPGPEMPANPEQLFGMAYSTCFLSALAATHSKLKPDLKPLPKTLAVTAKISIGKREKLDGFFLGVELEVSEGPLKEVGLGAEDIETLLKEAHKLCPYSRAIGNNVETQIRLAV